MTTTEAPCEAMRLPFLNGVYIAVDALADAYLIVDGPYCVFTKAEMQYCHNLRSRLLPPIGHRRVVHTGQVQDREEVKSLSTDRTAQVDGIFAGVCAQPDAGIVLSTTFDFHELVGFPMKEITRRHARPGGPLVGHIPSKSLGGTWLEGYARTCEALAQGATLRPGKRKRNAAALVGYLFDRDEPDHAGNLRELKRLLAGLGLSVESIWLSGGGRAELEAAERADVVISFPYAREAARTVAKRTGAKLIEVELPLGLSATERFLLKVAAGVGRRKQAGLLAAVESLAAVRETQSHVLRIIAGREADILQDDPHLDARLRELCSELGLLEGRPSGETRRRVRFAPTGEALTSEAVHVPMGYPNYVEHPVAERPFLGYTGFRHLVDRVAGAILRSEASGS
ncbi:MAG: nitrogenase component 1 [Elusimicrobia bacterium]|nr:nitrogenase component 1 [Elusimicrobiota bacterium]